MATMEVGEGICFFSDYCISFFEFIAQMGIKRPFCGKMFFLNVFCKPIDFYLLKFYWMLSCHVADYAITTFTSFYFRAPILLLLSVFF